jgi:peptide/nickel transport system substrate-binding protein
MKHIYFFFFIALSTFMQCAPKQESGLKIFKYNQASGITSLDPAFAKNQANIWAVSQLYNGLVHLNQNMNVAPAIAKSWAYSNDSKTITFILRNDVQFHQTGVFEQETRMVTAHDFVYSFNRIIDPKVASPGAWIFNGKIDTQKPFVALNDTTFQINLQQAFGPMLGILSMPYCFAVPYEAVSFYGKDFRAHPLGTGPFIFKVWEEGTALVALKNPIYFEKDAQGHQLPFVDGFKVTFMESKKMEFLTFMKGELDILFGVDKSFVDDILDENAELKTEWQDLLILYKSPFLNTEYLGFNFKGASTWLKFKEFRQAINYCYDKEGMIRYLRKGVGAPAISGFIPKGLPPYDDKALKGYNYDSKKAKVLLESISYDGTEVILSTNETYKDMALYIAKEAEKVGVKLKVDVVQPSLLREWMVNGQVDFFRGSWIADYPDAENYLSLFYSKNGAPPNYTRFKSSTFDKLYEQSFEIADLSERLNLYRKMDSILVDEAPVVFLYYDEILRITHNNIKNVRPNPLNTLDIKYIKKDKL